MKPKEGLSTPVVFRHLDYDRLARVKPSHLLEQFVEGGLAEAEYVNDLELPAFKAMPSLQKMKAELQVGTPEILSCCFGSCCCDHVENTMWNENVYYLLKASLLVPRTALAPFWPVPHLVLLLFSMAGLGV